MPHRGAKLLKFFKSRLPAKSQNTSVDKPSMISNVKRAIQSTSDLLNLKGAHENLSSTSLLSSARVVQRRYSFESSPGFTESCLPPSDGSSASSSLSHSHRSDGRNSTSTTKVLFSPSKPTNASRSKLSFNFSIKKCRSVSEFRVITESRLTLPTITLTTPEDEQAYILSRPSPMIVNRAFLAVPTRPSPSKSKYQENTFKKWPHPAGPWLRPTNHEHFRPPHTSGVDWVAGCRLGDGRVVGWDLEDMGGLGALLPPQLPTEQDLETIALVEQIAISLDQAQDALYGNLDEAEEIEDEEEEEEYGFSAVPKFWPSQDFMASQAALYAPEVMEIVI